MDYYSPTIKLTLLLMRNRFIAPAIAVWVILRSLLSKEIDGTMRRIIKLKSKARSIAITACMITALVAAFTAASLPLLPYVEVYGKPVPTFIFGEESASAFHWFIVSVMFAFSGSFAALFLQSSPKLAGFCTCYSLISAASAIILLSSG